MGRFPRTVVESPWPNDPAPALYFSKAGQVERSYIRAVKAQTRNPGNTHVVREIRVGFIGDHFIGPRPWVTVDNYSRGFLETTVDRAEEQFTVLAKYGIGIPDHEFAVVSDNLGRNRTLARIAIISGISCGPRFTQAFPGLIPYSVREELQDQLTDYRKITPLYDQLADISPRELNDFVYGVPRALPEGGHAANKPYLVDLEALFVTPQVT